MPIYQAAVLKRLLKYFQISSRKRCKNFRHQTPITLALAQTRSIKLNRGHRVRPPNSAIGDTQYSLTGENKELSTHVTAQTTRKRGAATRLTIPTMGRQALRLPLRVARCYQRRTDTDCTPLLPAASTASSAMVCVPVDSLRVLSEYDSLDPETVVSSFPST